MRVMVVAEHALLREGLRDLLRRWSGVELVGVAPAADDAGPMARRLGPDILLLVQSAAPKSDAQAVDSVRAQAKACRILLIEGPGQRGAAGDVGADFRVGKSVGLAGLVRLMWEMHTGTSVAGGGGSASRDPGSSELEEQPRQLLTGREYEVVQAVCEGLSNKEVGRLLGISAKTVKNHLSSVYRRVELTGRTDLVAWALRRGLASPQDDVAREPRRR
jgi:DNA-binding NarL/FixJ family response regulator